MVPKRLMLVQIRKVHPRSWQFNPRKRVTQRVAVEGQASRVEDYAVQAIHVGTVQFISQNALAAQMHEQVQYCPLLRSQMSFRL